MKKKTLMTALLSLLLIQAEALSQTDDPPRYEIAPEFRTLNPEASMAQGPKLDWACGLHLTSIRALHSRNPRMVLSITVSTCRNRGQALDVFGGIKAGKRFKSWGIFGKVRTRVS